MSDELKLLPCAHCGGEEIVGRVWGERLERELYHVACTACHIRTRNYDTPAEAAVAWNRRAAARQQWPQGEQAVEQLGDAWVDVRLQELIAEYGEGILAHVNMDKHRGENRLTAAAVLARLNEVSQ